MAYKELFLKMCSWDHLHYKYFGCWLQMQIYEAHDSPLTNIHPQGNSSPSHQSNQTSCDGPLSFHGYIYWLRVKFSKVGGERKKGENEGSLLLIQDLPHTTCTIIPHKILATSFLVNRNFKKN